MNSVFKNEPERDFTINENRRIMKDALSFVRDRFGETYPLIIGGERIPTEKTIKSVDPCDHKTVVGYAASADAALADKAVRTAYEAYESWRFVPARVRADYVMRLVGVLQRRRAEIAAWMIYETGKNYGEADGEICEAIDFFNMYAQKALELDAGIPLAESATENNSCFYIPIGVGIVIPPWNFPFSIMAGMAVAAAVTGNTVVIKPASDSPVICAKFMELVEEAGFPAGVMNYLPGSGSVMGDALTTHPLTRFINFTGSKEVGLRISRLAAEDHGQIWIKRVVAEMGGKNAIIVDSSADIELAAAGVATAAFGYQGQKCSACSRAVVDRSVYADFIDALRERTLKIKQGAGEDDADICAVISSRAYASITNYIEIGKNEGLLICGGTYDDSKGYFIAPTVIADVDRGARIAKEEIFGPVVAVMPANDFEDALAIANGTEYGLTGSVYSRSRDHLEEARRRFHVGNLYFNRKCTGAVVANHPFGGYNMSGTTAKTGTADYLRNFLQLKSVSENIIW